MDKFIKVAMIGAESAILAAILLGEYYLSILETALLAAHIYAMLRKSHNEKKDTLLLSRAILSRKMSQTPALTGLNQGSEVSRKLDSMLKKQQLGELNATPDPVETGPYSREFLNLISTWLNSGKSIKKNLELLAERLEYELKLENRFNSKIGGMRALTYAGLAFFLPLFGGISSSILGTSLGLAGSSSVILERNFLACVGIYAALALFINSSFSKPGSGIIERIYSTMPPLVFSSLIMLSTSVYSTSML